MPYPILTFSFGRGNPEPWRYIPGTRIMLNAFDVISRRAGIYRPDGIEVWVDSGGFQLLTGSVKELDVRDVLYAQLALDPDYIVMPDDPRSPERSLARYERFLELAEREEVPRGRLVPVVHSTWELEHLRRLFEMIRPRVLAIGGVANSLSRPFKLSLALSLLAFVSKVRGLIPRGTAVHLMGVGGLTLLPAMKVLGVASYDTASWIHDARYGIVRVGMRAYTVKVRGRDRLPPLPQDFKCSCPACTLEPGAIRDTGVRGLRARALHNAFNLVKLAEVLARAPSDPEALIKALRSSGISTRQAEVILRRVVDLEEGSFNPPM